MCLATSLASVVCSGSGCFCFYSRANDQCTVVPRQSLTKSERWPFFVKVLKFIVCLYPLFISEVRGTNLNGRDGEGRGGSVVWQLAL